MAQRSSGASPVKNRPAIVGDVSLILGREGPLEKGMATHSILLPGEAQGQRTLVGYRPWGHKESDTTEQQESSQLRGTHSIPDS